MSSSLHNHTEYSLLDGYGHPEEYLKEAQRLGLKAFAITEHGNQYSWVYFDEIKSKYPNIKMIYGVEFYECFDHRVKDKDNKYFHLIALARNENGRIALNELITKSNFEGFYSKPRVDLEMMKPYAKDLIVSSACLVSKLARENDFHQCIQYIQEYKQIFPYFYLEMQSHDTEEQCEYNQKILKLAQKTQTPFIITTDSHAATQEDLKYQGYHVQIAHDDETASEIYSGCYMQSDQEIHRIMDKQIGKENVDFALEETDRIADMIDVVNMPFQPPQLPTYPLPDGYQDNVEMLRDLCMQGWKVRGFDQMPEEDQKIRKDRMEYELGVIHQMGFDGYFLIVWDFVNYAKANNIIVGDGRGCFTKDALVWCKDTIKTIDKVKIGDFVLSADGHFHEVTNTFKYKINEPTMCFTYKQQGSSKKKYINRCTKDHKILVHRGDTNKYISACDLRNNDLLCSPKIRQNDIENYIIIDLLDYNTDNYMYDENFIYERTNINKTYRYSPRQLEEESGFCKSIFKRMITDTDFKPIKKVTLDAQEWLLKNTPFNSVSEYAKYTKSQNANHRKIKRKLVINEKTNYFIGIMYGDGWVRAKTNEFGIAVNSENFKSVQNKEAFYDFCQTVGLNTNKIYCANNTRKKCVQYIASSKIINNFLSSFLFQSDKHMPKKFNALLLNQKKSCLQKLYEGLLNTDGSVSFAEGKLCFDSTSLGLVSAFKTLNSILNYEPLAMDTRLAHEDRRGYCSSESYKLRRMVARENLILNDDEYWYLPIESVEEIGNETVDVFDLTVKDTHSFVINNICVHNSGGGSIVNYLLQISELDPIEYDLIFERFLNPERVSMPKLNWAFIVNLITQGCAASCCANGRSGIRPIHEALQGDMNNLHGRSSFVREPTVLKKIAGNTMPSLYFIKEGVTTNRTLEDELPVEVQ